VIESVTLVIILVVLVLPELNVTVTLVLKDLTSMMMVPVDLVSLHAQKDIGITVESVLLVIPDVTVVLDLPVTVLVVHLVSVAQKELTYMPTTVLLLAQMVCMKMLSVENVNHVTLLV
jgi:hypothetical protein